MRVAVVENVFYMKTCIVWQLQKPTTRNMCSNYCKYSKTLHVAFQGHYQFKEETRGYQRSNMEWNSECTQLPLTSVTGAA